MGLEAVELVLKIEDALEIKIPDAEASSVVTVGDLAQVVILNQLRSSTPPIIEGEALQRLVFERLRDIIADEFSLDPYRIQLDSELRRDLKID